MASECHRRNRRPLGGVQAVLRRGPGATADEGPPGSIVARRDVALNMTGLVA